ncbi:3'-5' exonuclease [Actinophytocola sp.]|uniref:3'-5' exonuclease n=1 Tax=Actinophytocola sp. TaxID=1872138 RepID=UPI002ED678B2
MTDWTRLRYAVVDVEGNGQQPPDLVEVAAVPIVGGVVGAPSSWLVRPARPITPIARRIHGLTNERVAGAPSFAEIEDEVRRVLDVDVLVAHNAHVDVGVLQRHLGEWRCPRVLDTLTLAKRLLPGQSSYKLGALVQAFGLAAGLPDDLSPHRATYDVLVAARLFVRLVTRDGGTPLSVEELRDEEPPTLF